MKSILAIIGSASSHSANEMLIHYLAGQTKTDFEINVYKDLKILPHFDPELSAENPPKAIIDLRNKIEQADGLIICTPEYVFSIPSGLKNAIEWCVATTVFSNKPTGLITASSSGQAGHEELKLIMKTVMAGFTDNTCLLIQGIKGKMNANGEITDTKTRDEIGEFVMAFKHLLTGK